jgi:hypothetical protein
MRRGPVARGVECSGAVISPLPLVLAGERFSPFTRPPERHLGDSHVDVKVSRLRSERLREPDRDRL